MEIRIQTHDEIRAGRVMIEISADGQGEHGPAVQATDEVEHLRAENASLAEILKMERQNLAESQARETRLAGEVAALTDERDKALEETRALDNANVLKDTDIKGLEKKCADEKFRADLNYGTARVALGKLSQIRDVVALADGQMADDIRAIFDGDDSNTERVRP